MLHSLPTCEGIPSYAHPLSTLPVPDARFQQIHLDIVGPLPPSRGFSYLLICIDQFSRWPEAFPMTDIAAESVARTFISGGLRVSVCPPPSPLIEDASLRVNSGDS